jgi:hypothetical protein
VHQNKTRTKIRVAAATAVTLAGVTACGTGAAQSVTDYCVEQTARAYEAHGLPFTLAVEDRPAACDRWMAVEGLTTKAQIKIALAEGFAAVDSLTGGQDRG